MECDYTYVNHYSLVSKEKSDQQGRDYKKGSLYFRTLFLVEIWTCRMIATFSNMQCMTVNAFNCCWMMEGT
jgi:hypothetical protein